MYPRTFTYISAARGYKAGGYNVQMFADLIQDQLKYDLMSAYALNGSRTLSRLKMLHPTNQNTVGTMKQASRVN